MDKALVVDDHGIDSRLKSTLSLGYSVIERTHPYQAMELLHDGLRPDLIISDVDKHPKYNGIEFAKRARKLLDPDGKIYLMSGHFGEETQGANGDASHEAHELFLDGVINGFAPRISGAGMEKVMTDLINSPSFLLFAAKYGFPIFDGLDSEELRLLAQHEVRSKYGLALSFGGNSVDRFPFIQVSPIFLG